MLCKILAHSFVCRALFLSCELVCIHTTVFYLANCFVPQALFSILNIPRTVLYPEYPKRALFRIHNIPNEHCFIFWIYRALFCILNIQREHCYVYRTYHALFRIPNFPIEHCFVSVISRALFRAKRWCAVSLAGTPSYQCYWVKASKRAHFYREKPLKFGPIHIMTIIEWMQHCTMVIVQEKLHHLKHI